MWRPTSGTIFGLVALLACSSTRPAAPAVVGEGTRILFIGNSLTYVNDVPGILQALADSAGGERLAVASLALPNYALIDHWVDGIAQREIAKGGWAWVVMQQGWTPAGIYRDTLRLATRNFGAVIAKVGAKAALYQTWPPVDRPNDFAGSPGSRPGNAIRPFHCTPTDCTRPLAARISRHWSCTRESSIARPSDCPRPFARTPALPCGLTRTSRESFRTRRPR